VEDGVGNICIVVIMASYHARDKPDRPHRQKSWATAFFGRHQAISANLRRRANRDICEARLASQCPSLINTIQGSGLSKAIGTA
jgi:hypothetical protein